MTARPLRDRRRVLVRVVLALLGVGLISAELLREHRKPNALTVLLPFESHRGSKAGMTERRAPSAASLFAHFTSLGYTLDSVRQLEAVPRIYLAGLPHDLPEIASSDVRKAVFVKMMLPLLLAENERIHSDRLRVLALRERLNDGRPVRDSELVWLASLAARYGTDDRKLDELLRRIDVIPPALALGQAALETGWGTSSVAQKNQALFGQMEFRSAGDSAISAVRSFSSLAAAVRAYALNLNTHKAYAEFRTRRAEMRLLGRELDGHELAIHLDRYSERRHDYVRAVRGIIRANNFQPFDQARLRD